MTVILWNAQSIRRKTTELKTVIKQISPTIVGITETWLSDKENIKIPNYSIIRRDRPVNENGKSYGGILLAVKNNLQYIPLDLNSYNGPNNAKLEITAIKVELKPEQWITVCIAYNPSQRLKKSTAHGARSSWPPRGPVRMVWTWQYWPGDKYLDLS